MYHFCQQMLFIDWMRLWRQVWSLLSLQFLQWRVSIYFSSSYSSVGLSPKRHITCIIYFLVTDAVHRLDVAQVTSVEFAQLAVVEGEYLLLLSLVGLSPVSYTHITNLYIIYVLSPDVVHRLDVTQETSVEFAQHARVVEGEYYPYHRWLSPKVHTSHTTCIIYFLLNRCCSSTGCDSGDKCGVCSGCGSCGGGCVLLLS